MAEREKEKDELEQGKKVETAKWPGTNQEFVVHKYKPPLRNRKVTVPQPPTRILTLFLACYPSVYLNTKRKISSPLVANFVWGLCIAGTEPLLVGTQTFWVSHRRYHGAMVSDIYAIAEEQASTRTEQTLVLDFAGDSSCCGVSLYGVTHSHFIYLIFCRQIAKVGLLRCVSKFCDEGRRSMKAYKKLQTRYHEKVKAKWRARIKCLVVGGLILLVVACFVGLVVLLNFVYL